MTNERNSIESNADEDRTRTTIRGKRREDISEQENGGKERRKNDNINIGTFNIIDGRSNRLELASWNLERHNIDICFLTETKLNGYHTSSTYGYDVIATKCSNPHQGGVALLYRKSKEWHLEDTKTIGDNIIRTTLVSRAGRIILIGVYRPPSEEDLKTIHQLDETLKGTENSKLIIMGDLNVKLDKPKNHIQEEVTNALQSYNLRDIAKNFKSREKKKKYFSWTWRIEREGEKIQSKVDYILSNRDINWKRYSVIDTEFDSDHRLIVGKLWIDKQLNYRNYLRSRTPPPMRTTTDHTSQSPNPTPDNLLEDLTELSKEERKNMKQIPQQDKSWISERTFTIMRRKTDAKKKGKDEETKRLGKEVRRSLRKDRRNRVARIADQIEEHMEKKDIIGAYDILRHWYSKFTGKVPKPSAVKLTETKEIYDRLFQKVPLPDGEELEFPYDGPTVDDTAPTEEEIITALYRMRNRKAPGITGITVEDLKRWEQGANPGEKGTTIRAYKDAWEKVVKIVKEAIGHGKIPTAFSIGTLVIIPKDEKGGVRGIGLLEVIHKLISQVINLRLNAHIKFLPEIHGFRRQRGTHTAIGEAKIRMQIASCNSTPLYQIYLDLSKAYDSIDREQTLEIMRTYKIGPNIRQYVKKVWDQQTFYLRQSGFYSEGINVNRGCTQGDTDSPIIFNLIVDAVLRTWKTRPDYRNSITSFYADDGLIENEDPQALQEDLNTIVTLFQRIGLKTNDRKTKYMIAGGTPITKAIPQEKYIRLMRTRKNTIGREQLKEKCEICGKVMLRRSISRHMKTIHASRPTRYAPITETENGTYRIRVNKNRRTACPVEGCPGGGMDKHSIYRHFCFKHPRAKIIIAEDGELPRCPLCGYFTGNLDQHQRTEVCRKGRARRVNEEKQKKQAKVDEIKFYVKNKELERVREFTYLGRVFSEDDNDTKCIERQLSKAKSRWWRMARILKHEGANAKTMAKFYMAIIQAILLYGAESWALTRGHLRKLNSFHLRSVRYMTGKHIRKRENDSWEYPNHEDLLTECRLKEIGHYIEQRRNTLGQYLRTHKIELMHEANRTRTPSRNIKKNLWWNQ